MTDIATLITLPSEILDTVVKYLSPEDLAHTSFTCKRLAKVVTRDQLWQQLIQKRTPLPLSSPAPYPTWKKLYGAHHPHWFLTQHKFWFSDDLPYGKLIVARYDARRGCIEAYAVAATHSTSHEGGLLDWGVGEASYQEFNPIVRLDLNSPIVRLTPDDYTQDCRNDDKLHRHSSRMRPEVSMKTVDRLSTSFNFTRDLPPSLVDSQTQLWPPLTVQSPNGARTRTTSTTSYRSHGHIPQSIAEASTTTFRVRTRMPFHPLLPTFMAGTGSLPAERVDTFGTLDAASYTPTPEKPWQGIWVGDYSAHGCEFLLITQPDDPQYPLPEKARLAFANWPRCAPWQSLWPGDDADDFQDVVELDGTPIGDGTSDASSTSDEDEAHAPSLDVLTPASGSTESSRDRDSASASSDRHPDKPPHRGRLIATKLTGDPNVPRGEYTFIVSDLGADGLVGHTRERGFVPPHIREKLDDEDGSGREHLLKSGWKGSRIVRSVLHIADAGNQRDSYIPSQTVLVSEDVIALWWMIAPHVSFYRRVDVGALLKV